MDAKEKVWENRLRRMAKRQALQLMKSRVRDPRAVDFGRYMIVDPYTNTIVAGGHGGFDLTIDQVEAYLTEDA